MTEFARRMRVVTQQRAYVLCMINYDHTELAMIMQQDSAKLLIRRRTGRR
jgi:hypothetical protein